MKPPHRKIIFGLCGSLALAAFTPAAWPAQDSPLVEGNTAFALDLYGRIKSGEGNLFLSPYSISTALAATYAGARGDTEKQIARVLHFSQQQSHVHSPFGELQRRLIGAGKEGGIELSIANALWAQQGHPFLPDFLKIARTDYQAEVNQADFESQAESARGQINQWVQKQTHDKIKDILPPGSLDEATRLVLANAIYFKGAWLKAFDKSATFNLPFHVSATDQVETPLMQQMQDVRYMENGDFQAVELPYKGGALSMVILLPTEIGGCGKLESQLTAELLLNSLSRMKMQKIQLYIPRFKLESSFDLNAVLSAMGLTDAFDPRRADFSGMDGTKNLSISHVFHKAWGEVNEEGTEAAASTVATVTFSAVRQPEAPPPVFRADHPFIFLIRDMRSGSILFLGRLADPSK